MDGGWVVLRTHRQHELMAARAVGSHGVESYVPLLPRTRPSGPTPPLFPGYLFARVDSLADDLIRIRSAPGVAYTLPQGGPPALLPGHIVDTIRDRLASRNGGPAATPFHNGDAVTLTAGPFRWVEAIFDKRLNAAGRVRILLELAHRTVRLDVDATCLKRV